MKIPSRDIHKTSALSTVTPEDGELLIDKEKGVVVIGDGVTKGGVPSARQDLSNMSGINSEAATDGPSIVLFDEGGAVVEHTGLTGSYDHTGGDYEKQFTSTTSVFTQDDADSKNWVRVTSGTYKGAMAKISEYVSGTVVLVHPLGWSADMSDMAFEIIQHPVMVVGAGFHSCIQANNSGHFCVESSDTFTGDSEPNMTAFRMTAGDHGTTAIRCVVKSMGYYSVTAQVLTMDTGDIPAGASTAVSYSHADVEAAVNATSDTQVISYVADTSGDSDATTIGFLALEGFDTAFKVFGSPAVDPGYGYKVASGSVTDQTTEFTTAGTDVDVFEADDDYILIGSDNTFEVIQLNLATESSKNCQLELYYSKAGGNWTALTAADTSEGFSSNGSFYFVAPGDWTKDDEAEANGDITNAYYIKLVRTYSPALAVTPTESYFKIYASQSAGMQIRGDGTLAPASLADSNAVNNSLYYSETQSKLVYKDGAGAVNVLY